MCGEFFHRECLMEEAIVSVHILGVQETLHDVCNDCTEQFQDSMSLRYEDQAAAAAKAKTAQVSALLMLCCICAHACIVLKCCCYRRLL